MTKVENVNIDNINIENIKIEIKEKIRKNPRYVNPCSKEFQEDIKRFGFNSGNMFISFLKQNGILKNDAYIDNMKNIENTCIIKSVKKYIEENSNKRIYVIEKYLTDENTKWEFRLKQNNVPNYGTDASHFMLIGWKSRGDAEPEHVWLVPIDTTIRGEFCYIKQSITIRNNPGQLLNFKKFEITDSLLKRDIQNVSIPSQDINRYNPMSKEFQDNAKEAGLLGYEYHNKLIKEGKIANPTDIDNKRKDTLYKRKGFNKRQDYEDDIAKKLGYENENQRYGWDKRLTKEYQKEMEDRRAFRKTKEYRDVQARENGFKDDNDRRNNERWESGKTVPMSDYEDCESHIGICIGEDKIAKHILDRIFESVDKKRNNNPGFEYICKNPRQEFIDKFPQFKLEKDKEYKIDIKTAHFIDEYWKYRIDHNDTPDYFMSIALGTVDNIAQHTWFIHKNDVVRNVQFWRRAGIKISKSQDHILEFKKFEITDTFYN